MNMQKSQQHFFFLAIVAVGWPAGAALVGCDRGAVSGAGPAKLGVISATPVRVVTVERREIPVAATFHGFLEAFVELSVPSQVAGVITEQWVDVADDVTEGSALYKIDDETRRFELKQARARQDKATNELATAKANWDRIRKLTDQTSTSLEHVEAERTYLAAQAVATEADAAADHAQLMLARTTVSAPIDGVVSHVHQRKGEFVQHGQALLDVVEIDRLKLVAEVADHEVVWMRVGDQVTLESDVFPGEAFAAAIRRVYTPALPGSRKFQIEIEIANPQRRLRPGFFVQGRIAQTRTGNDVDADQAVTVIPREALFERFGQFLCYRIESDAAEAGGRLSARQVPVVVRSVPSDPGIMRVESGLSVGDRVATKGIQHLSDGAAVRIVE